MPTVILTTLDERENIAPLLRELVDRLSPRGKFELLVVDDASPDGTADAAQAVAAADPRIRVEVRAGARGLAGAVRHGIERARGDAVVVMNADFQHAPALVPRLLDLLDTHDVAATSRFVPGGGMASRLRYWPSRAFSTYARLLLDLPVHDATSGFFAARAESLRGLDLDRVFRGYGEWFYRMLTDLDRAGRTIAEIPVVYPPRRAGRSKARLLRLLPAYVADVTGLAFRRVFRSPRRHSDQSRDRTQVRISEELGVRL